MDGSACAILAGPKWKMQPTYIFSVTTNSFWVNPCHLDTQSQVQLCDPSPELFPPKFISVSKILPSVLHTPDWWLTSYSAKVIWFRVLITANISEKLPTVTALRKTDSKTRIIKTAIIVSFIKSWPWVKFCAQSTYYLINPQSGPVSVLCVLSCFSRVQLFATLWAVAVQAPLSMGFSRQEYWIAMPSSRASSASRDWTHVSYVSWIGRWVLYH